MFKIWCEWDINHEGFLFSSEAAANRWLLKNVSLRECFEDGLTGQEAIDDLISGGLLGIESVTVVGDDDEDDDWEDEEENDNA